MVCQNNYKIRKKKYTKPKIYKKEKINYNNVTYFLNDCFL